MDVAAGVILRQKLLQYFMVDVVLTLAFFFPVILLKQGRCYIMITRYLAKLFLISIKALLHEKILFLFFKNRIIQILMQKVVTISQFTRSD